MIEEPDSRLIPADGRVMNAHYRLDTAKSKFTAQAFAAGLLSFVGHSPTFAVREFEGHIRWAPGSSESSVLRITAQAGSLTLIDQVSPSDREEIETRMRREVLESSVHPQIQFQADEIATTALAPDRFRAHLGGEFSLHGVTRRESVDAELHLYSDGLRLVGKFQPRLANYGIQGVTALGGSIHLREQVLVSFDFIAWKEPEQ